MSAGRVPRPTPKAMGGRTDPAKRVRPVDWSAVPRRPAPEPASRPDEEDSSPSARLPRRRRRTIELPRPLPAAPEDAVHTLSAEDPRPLPRPLRIVPALPRNETGKLPRRALLDLLAAG